MLWRRNQPGVQRLAARKRRTVGQRQEVNQLSHPVYRRDYNEYMRREKEKDRERESYTYIDMASKSLLYAKWATPDLVV